ncbi:MAG: heme NO-binding domain-containing protein [Oxalobacteraceae bacterium]
MNCSADWTVIFTWRCESCIATPSCPREHERLADNRMLFVYRSSRALADFAEGLIEGCVAHFGEPMHIERTDLATEGGGSHTRFTLTRLHGHP